MDIDLNLQPDDMDTDLSNTNEVGENVDAGTYRKVLLKIIHCPHH